MDNKIKMLKDAIAQSQLIKEASIAEVKKSFEEHFNPQIRSILSAKLNEMDENNIDDGMNEDIDLASILSELEGEDPLDEAKKTEGEDGESEDKDKDEDLVDEPKDKDKDKPKAKKDETEDEEVPVDDPEAFKEYVAQLVADIYADQSGEGNKDEDYDSDDLDFSLEDEKPKEDLDEDFLFELDDYGVADSGYDPDLDYGDDEELEYEELEDDMSKLFEAKTSILNLRKQLNRSNQALNSIRVQLTEANLLKEKSNLINKLFKSKSLSESQKIRAIDAFDKAKTTKEVKLVFESLNVIGNTKNPGIKNDFKRNLGFASKASGVTKKLNENRTSNIIDPDVARMMKLAGIK